MLAVMLSRELHAGMPWVLSLRVADALDWAESVGVFADMINEQAEN
jgi:hypothetical protein